MLIYVKFYKLLFELTSANVNTLANICIIQFVNMFYYSHTFGKLSLLYPFRCNLHQYLNCTFDPKASWGIFSHDVTQIGRGVNDFVTQVHKA